MLIVCPNCATSYTLSSPALGASGRTVRCARCKQQWFVAPNRDVSAFVDDVIAEAESRESTDAAQANEQAPPQSTRAGPSAGAPEAGERWAGDPPPAPAAHHGPADEVAQFTAALDDVSAVEPLAHDDVAPANRHQDSDETETITDSPPIVPREEPHPADSDREDIEHFAALRAQRLASQRKRNRATQIPALLVMLGVIAGAILFWRNDLVRHLPQTASLFSAIGMPVNVRGLVFEDVAISKETHDGVTVLVVEGKIVSTGNGPADVPRLRFAVRNATGNEIYSWTAQPSRSILGAGESMPFRTRLASPPAEANDVLVRFFSARDLAAGVK